MEPKTLEELNQDFMVVGAQSKRKSNFEPIMPRAKFEPIIPLVIEFAAPQKVKPAKSAKAGKIKPEAPGSRKGQTGRKSAKKRHRPAAIILDILLVVTVIALLFSALISDSNGDAPRTFLGYSYFAVLTPSMQDEIPQDSLILVKHIEPQELRVGDNITYVTGRSLPVTHKIIEIHENHNGDGAIGFSTQGVNNANPDREIVGEAEVVGKVMYVLPAVGAILSGLAENAVLVFILFGLCVFLSFFLRWKFIKPTKRQHDTMQRQAA